jgi:hypothetical protein
MLSVSDVEISENYKSLKLIVVEARIEPSTCQPDSPTLYQLGYPSCPSVSGKGSSFDYSFKEKFKSFYYQLTCPQEPREC